MGVVKSYAIAARRLDSDSDPDMFVGHSNGPSDNEDRIWFKTVWGACCADVGCVQAEESICELFGGVFLGGHCADTDCGLLYEMDACCVDSGCTQLTVEACDELGDTWIANSDCGDCTSGLAEDVDNDGTVGSEDLARLPGAWGTSS